MAGHRLGYIRAEVKSLEWERMAEDRNSMGTSRLEGGTD